MRPSLAELAAPAHTALVTSECQNGVIGAQSALPELAAQARRTVLRNGPVLVRAARAAGVPVVHCLAGRRPDGRGSNSNARLFAAMLRAPVPLHVDTAAARVVDELDDAGDLRLTRLHGLSPMSGTGLDPVLRNLGTRTLVVVGVSVNVAVTNLVMDAVNLGYQVVLPRDAVAGVPAEYAEQVLEHTLSLLATVVTTQEVAAAWEAAPDIGRG